MRRGAALRSGAALLGRLGVWLLCAACGAPGGDKPAARPAAELIMAALRGEDGECARPAECASGVCSSGSCAALADGGQLWKAYALAQTLRPLLTTPDGLATARPLLLQLAQDERAHVREHVAVFLGAVGLPALAPLLDPLAADADSAVQLQASLAQVRVGAIAPRERLLNHSSVAVRLAAVDALGAWLSHAPDAADGAVDLLATRALSSSEDHRVIQRALLALMAIKTPDAELLAELTELGQDHAEGFLAHDVARLLEQWHATP